MKFEELKTLGRRKLQRIADALAVQPMTVHDLIPAVHSSKSGVTRYLVAMHAGELGREYRVYIHRWERRTGCCAPVYGLGNKPDAPRPRAYTAAERMRRSRENMRADPEAHAKYLQRERARRIKPKRDPAAFWVPTR